MVSQNRPYRVGMARPAQRYIEPDEIYTDLAPGAPTQIPREFPYSWNPVNGFQPGTAYGPLNGLGASNPLLDSLLAAGQAIVGTNIVQDNAEKGVNQFLATPAGAALLDAVEAKAQQGVTEVVKQNAPHLLVLAVAGGAVGGAILGKLGKTGTVAALLLAGWSAMKILNPSVPTAPVPGASQRKPKVLK